MPKIHKLYCYVDETGQDTKGQFYIVVAVTTIAPKEGLDQLLEAAEYESGKGKLKWHKNSTRKRDAYIERTIRAKLPLGVYYRIFEGPELSYEMTTVLAASNAIRVYLRQRKITSYKATVVIDGLPRSLQGQVGRKMRRFGIKTKSVRGERDEASPVIRLADAVAGLLRQAYRGDAHFEAMRRQLEKKRLLEFIP